MTQRLRSKQPRSSRRAAGSTPVCGNKRGPARCAVPTWRPNPLDRYAGFGKSPVLLGENATYYAQQLAGLDAGLAPLNFIEEVWVWDLAILRWDAIRYLRIKDQVILDAFHKCLLARLAQDGTDPDEAKRLLDGLAAGNAEVTKDLEHILRRVGSGLDEVLADAYFDQIEQIERLDRMIATVQARRDSILREFDRRREILARRICEEVEEGEFAELE